MKRILFAILLGLFAAPSFAATCFISEYTNIIRDGRNYIVPVAQEPAVTIQTVTYTTTTQSAAFDSTTKLIRIVCDAKAHFEFGTNPTATASDPYLAADTPEYFGVDSDNPEDYEVAFYDGTS